MNMAPAENESTESMSTKSFSDMYNKWLQELNVVEKNIVSKAGEIQSLQTNLTEDAESVRSGVCSCFEILKFFYIIFVYWFYS